MKLLMTHLYYGDPSERFSHLLAKTLVVAGADILEIGIPYSDPVCDGEVFQKACERALEGGITPLKVLLGIRELRSKGIAIPIYLTSYYPPIFTIGVRKFVERAKDIGVTGLIVPDILLEEQEELIQNCRKEKIHLPQFATVYSSLERLKLICKTATGFIYLISLPGITGDDFRHLDSGIMDSLEVNLRRLIQNVKSLTDKKIYVGFGIKSRKDAKEILEIGADGIIVGSAIAQIYADCIDQPHESLPKIASFVKKIKESTIKKEKL